MRRWSWPREPKRKAGHGQSHLCSHAAPAATRRFSERADVLTSQPRCKTNGQQIDRSLAWPGSDHTPMHAPRRPSRRCTTSMCCFELEPGARPREDEQVVNEPAQNTAKRARSVSARESCSSDDGRVRALVVRASVRGARGAAKLASSVRAPCTLQRHPSGRRGPETRCYPSV